MSLPSFIFDSQYDSKISNNMQLYLPSEGLSKRQMECLHYLVEGLSSKKIARLMGISSRTVDDYLETIKQKFGCSSRQVLIRKALCGNL